MLNLGKSLTLESERTLTCQPFIYYLFFFNSSNTQVAFWFKKRAKYTCDVPTPLMKWHLNVVPVKIGQNVTFAKRLKHRGQNFHFF